MVLWYGNLTEFDFKSTVGEVPERMNESTDCLEFLTKEKKFQWASSCHNKNEFICRKIVPVTLASGDEELLLQGRIIVAPTRWWLICLLILLFAILVGLSVYCFIQKKKDTQAVVQTQKVPVHTPMGSPRGEKEVPSATIPDDVENAGFDESYRRNSEIDPDLKQ